MKSIREIKNQLEGLSTDEKLKVLLAFESDERKGIQKLLASLKRTKEKEEALLKKSRRMASFDAQHGRRRLLCGIDEAGRGPLAGPVVAAAVILPEDSFFLGLDDSKKLSKDQRDTLFVDIHKRALAVGVGIVDEKTIDSINILEATKLAMRRAVEDLGHSCEKALVDAVHFDHFLLPVVSIVKGDEKSAAIAAASVIAKVTRDRILLELHERYPEYGFSSHKGYGTAAHYEALKKWGPSPVHRRSFL